MPLLLPITALLRLKFGKFLTDLFVWMILVAIIVSVIAVNWLRSPYFQIVSVAGYWLFIAMVANSLYDCFQAARTPEQKSQLQQVTFWFAMTVLGAGTHLVAVFRSADRDYVHMATDLGLFIALRTVLKLVEALLKTASPTFENSKEGPPTVPKLDLSQNPEGISASGLSVVLTPPLLLGCVAPALIGSAATFAFIVAIVTSPVGWTGMFEGFPRWLAALCIIPFALVGLVSVLSLVVLSASAVLPHVSFGGGPANLTLRFLHRIALPIVVVALVLVLLWLVWR
jgi:hypothetical protein